MAFTITRSDGTLISVSLTQDDTYSLTLTGTGSTTYPQDIAQNFVRHLENFANNNPPEGTTLRGQLWYNTLDSKLKLYDGASWVDVTSSGGSGGNGYTGSSGYTGSQGVLGYTGSQGPAGDSSGGETLSVVTGTTQLAVINTHYILTNAAATTVTLPASPSVGNSLRITVANGRTDNVVAVNGSKIMTYTSDLILNIANSTIQLRYVNNSLGWWIV